MQTGGSGSQFFNMLDAMKPAFEKVPSLKPTTLRFDASRGELRMQVEAANYGQLETFTELLSHSYKVDSGAMNSNDSNVTSTLTIRSK